MIGMPFPPFPLPACALISFLLAGTFEGQWGERSATIFAKEYAERTWEIVVPHHDTVVGYAEGMAEAVTVLAEVEERSQLNVFDDLASARVWRRRQKYGGVGVG